MISTFQGHLLPYLDEGEAIIDGDWLQSGDAVHMTARLRYKNGPGFVEFDPCSGQVLESITRRDA